MIFSNISFPMTLGTGGQRKWEGGNTLFAGCNFQGFCFLGFFYYYYQWPGGESFFLWGGNVVFFVPSRGRPGPLSGLLLLSCCVTLVVPSSFFFLVRPMTGDRRVDDPWSAEDRSLIYWVPETPGQEMCIKELSESDTDVTLCERSAMGISSNRVSSLEDPDYTQVHVV